MKIIITSNTEKILTYYKGKYTHNVKVLLRELCIMSDGCITTESTWMTDHPDRCEFYTTITTKFKDILKLLDTIENIGPGTSETIRHNITEIITIKLFDGLSTGEFSEANERILFAECTLKSCDKGDRDGYRTTMPHEIENKKALYS